MNGQHEPQYGASPYSAKMQQPYPPQQVIVVVDDKGLVERDGLRNKYEGIGPCHFNGPCLWGMICGFFFGILSFDF